MRVVWVKDGKIGHEKQVKVLLDKLSETTDLSVIEKTHRHSFLNKIYNLINYITFGISSMFLSQVQLSNDHLYIKHNADIIIGAGNGVHYEIIRLKRLLSKHSKKQIKAITILSPTYLKNKFDIICAPLHDKHKYSNDLNNVIYFEGSLSTISTNEPDINTILIAVGGINKHYHFEEDHLISQISFFVSLNTTKNCYIFNTRRTPTSMNTKLKLLSDKFDNIIFCDFKETDLSFEDILHKSSSKLISRDSVNMIYESLSCIGDTYLLDMKSKSEKNKIVKNVNSLIINRKVGYIDCGDLVEGLAKMKLCKQNEYNEVMAEVEKVAYALNKVI